MLLTTMWITVIDVLQKAKHALPVLDDPICNVKQLGTYAEAALWHASH